MGSLPGDLRFGDLRTRWVTASVRGSRYLRVPPQFSRVRPDVQVSNPLRTLLPKAFTFGALSYSLGLDASDCCRSGCEGRAERGYLTYCPSVQSRTTASQDSQPWGICKQSVTGNQPRPALKKRRGSPTNRRGLKQSAAGRGVFSGARERELPQAVSIVRSKASLSCKRP